MSRFVHWRTVIIMIIFPQHCVYNDTCAFNWLLILYSDWLLTSNYCLCTMWNIQYYIDCVNVFDCIALWQCSRNDYTFKVLYGYDLALLFCCFFFCFTTLHSNNDVLNMTESGEGAGGGVERPLNTFEIRTFSLRLCDFDIPPLPCL